MRGGDDRNPAIESKIPVPTDSSDGLRRSKRLASSTNIYDIPKELLVEILCRLPCAKSVYRCKSVSKSWGSLTSDSYFVGRLLWLQRDNQTLIPGTIINQLGDELLTTDLFATFRRFFEFEHKKGRLIVLLATWNDLVLCEDISLGEYYIYNPRTMQLVNLPPIHQCRCIWGCRPAVGFICEPYYKEEEDRLADNSDQKEEEERKVIKIDAEYKCKVVRILHPDDKEKLCFEFKIQVFSSEIGEWRESLVSCPRGFIYSGIYSRLVSRFGFASNGMLYWNATDGDLLGLGPLMINKKSTTTCSSTTANGDSGYQFHVIKLVRQELEDEDLLSSLYYLQVHHGRLQLVQTVENEDPSGVRLSVWELKKEELEQMAVQGGGELGQKHRKTYNLMDQVYYHELTSLEYMGSDPNDLDTCFVSLTDYHHDREPVTYKCNIHTGEWSEMETTFTGLALQVMFPWWPTPVPTISVCSHTE
ncbi:putative F-box domain-containing protein [Rosa chinensis]|uniref:Putative F-box domain-containing protein n=1 Tax=Rosa chinensis TaxID=74649 RepID=A0A2P6RJ68_ROSCH|nr:putative F-box domain-containing protein [Rosa chinensis]